MSIFSGSCDALENIGCVDGSTSTETYTIEGSLAGTDYYVYVAYWYGSSSSPAMGDISISIECLAPPVCAAPQLNLIAVDQPGTPVEGCLPMDGEFYVMAILSGGSGNDSYSVSANSGDPVNVLKNTSHTFGPFSVGTDVNIVATGADDEQCGAEGSVESPAVCPPSNDLCEDAIALECGEIVYGNTSGATPDDAGCYTYGSNGNGVWYTYTPSVNSIVTLQTCLDTTNFDSDLNVYTGECGALECFNGFSDDGYTDGQSSGLPYCSGYRAGGIFTAEAGVTYHILLAGYGTTSAGDFGLQIDCEELTCDSPSLVLAAVANPNNEPIEGCVTSGSDYYVSATLSGGSGNASYSVSANGGDAVEVAADGSYTFGPFSAGSGVTVSAVGNDSDICGAEESIDSPTICPPSNDLCGDAIALECGETVTGNTLGATPDDAGCASYGAGGNGVWYTITPTEASVITLQTCLEGTNFDTDLNVYTGACDDLTCFSGFSEDGYTDGTSSDLPSCGGGYPLSYRAGGLFYS